MGIVLVVYSSRRSVPRLLRLADKIVARANSLLAAAVQEFLQDCARALRESDSDDAHPVLDRDYNEMLRAAGRRFMLRAGAGTYGLYDACNGVAALRHEGDDGIGLMLIARRHHPAVIPVLTLETPIALRDTVRFVSGGLADLRR